MPRWEMVGSLQEVSAVIRPRQLVVVQLTPTQLLRGSWSQESRKPNKSPGTKQHLVMLGQVRRPSLESGAAVEPWEVINKAPK